MNTVTEVRKLLEKLVKSTDSPVYAVCDEIASYLENHPQQQDLTIGGLKAALKDYDRNDSVLIQAAFALTAHPFNALEVRYRLYDESISDVIEELNHSTYMNAVSEGHLIDHDGNDIGIEELHARAFPYFINQLQNNAITKAYLAKGN
jgi:hypothetical protein